MKLRLVWLFPVIIFSNLYGQVVTTSPQFPTENDNIKIYFDATKGDGGLKDYPGRVYAHTGVTINGDRWQNVVGPDWGDDVNQPELTRISPNFYLLEIGNPHTFYNVPESEKITELSFVFRSAGSSGPTGRDVGGADIFVTLSEAGPNVKITVPDGPTFVELNSSVNFKIDGSNADSIALFIDEIKVTSTTTNTINYSYTASSIGKKNVEAIAYHSSGNVADSSYIFVNPQNNISELPAGVEYGINYINSTSVTLALHAPGKEFVYLIGEFNNWEADLDFQMNLSEVDSTFWLTLNNLEAGKEFAFQYYIDGKLKLADPYTDKILDPWNDKYISSSTYPNLKQYPENKTEGVVSVFQTNQTSYGWEVENFVKPNKEDLVIYELLVRDFVAEHDYKTLIDSLDYFTRLGVNAIELMPINEFEGNTSWGYNPSFLFAPDKYYGPKDDLKRFIDECHKRDIAVIMDIVLNHSYGLSPFVQMYFKQGKPAANNPWFNEEHNFQTEAAHWGYDFNHESEHTQKLVDRITKYWLTEYKFDGFRFDFTKGIGNNKKLKSVDEWGSLYDADRVRLLKRMTDKILEVDPNAFVIFEHLAENKEEKELAEYGILLWGNMNHSYIQAAKGFTANNQADLSSVLYTKRGWTEPNLISYMESHDEERLMYESLQNGNSTQSGYNIKNIEIAIERQMLAAAFFYTLPGPKMLWQFGELGYDFSINYNGRVGEKPIRWDYFQDPARKNLYKVTAELIKLKTNHDVFNTKNIDNSLSNTVKRINLVSDTMSVTVIGNFDVTINSVDPNFTQTGWWYDFFSGDSINVTNVNADIELLAGEFHIYSTKKLQTPEQGILTSIEELTGNLVETYGLTQNYPNPFNPSTTFKYQIPEETKVTVRIYNSIGQVVKTFDNSTQSKGAYKVIWNGENDFGQKVSSGVYFYQLITDEYTETKKMILMK